MKSEYLMVTYDRTVPMEQATPKDLPETDRVLAQALLGYCAQMTSETNYSILLMMVMIDGQVKDPYSFAEYLMVVLDKPKLFLLLTEHNKRLKVNKK